MLGTVENGIGRVTLRHLLSDWGSSLAKASGASEIEKLPE